MPYFSKKYCQKNTDYRNSETPRPILLLLHADKKIIWRKPDPEDR
jgi:hypothetical protein